MTYIKDTETIIAADLDGTLTESKVLMTPEMAGVISKWLETNRFAVISGAAFEQFLKQIVATLPPSTNLENLYLFPSNGAESYSFLNNEWKGQTYEKLLSPEEKETITSAVREAVKNAEVVSEEIFGEQIDYPNGEVTFSALGQLAPIEKKVVWDPAQEKRKRIVAHLAPLIPDFSVLIAGTTSINITRKGIDKAYAIAKMKELLSVDNEHIIFFGDAIFEGGNDFPATTTGVTCIKVSGPKETIVKINDLLILI